MNASPQFNLDLTDGIFEDTNRGIVQHDCLHVAASTEKGDPYEIISYCMGEWPSKWDIKPNPLDPVFTFDELYKQNVTSEQLYRWSAPMDIIHRYQYYLNYISVTNETSTLGSDLFYNCTLPRFGSQCQYSFDGYMPYHSSFNDIIHDYYLQPYKPKTLTCYTHLQCDLGASSTCLDWSEICDGKVDCANEVDEKFCLPLVLNECKYDEYRCDNGQCIPKAFVNDGGFNNFECLDQSDERQNSLIHLEYIQNKPTFANENVICSWREKNIFEQSGEEVRLSSSCVRQRQTILREAMFSEKSNTISDDCFLAFKCYFGIPTDDNSICSDFCQNRSCIEIVNDTCPEIFFVPTGPVAYGHIHLVFSKERAIQWNSTAQIPPDYICYNGTLCGESFASKSLLFIGGKTCGRPEDFSIDFLDFKEISYLAYLKPLYLKLIKCNRITYGNSEICNDGMYQCKNSSKCIPIFYIGDGFPDCEYGDDEEQTIIDFGYLTDQSTIFFKCSTSNKYIHRNKVKNGICDCEMDGYGLCDDEYSELIEMRQKIRYSTMCDRFVDYVPIMIDGQIETDETNCEQWPCNNTYTRCDGFWNCPDGGDEINCDPSPLIKCSPYHHICVSPYTDQLICLPIEKANDGMIDCLGGIDEPSLCPVVSYPIKKKSFYCKIGSTGECIPPAYLCDGIIDCTDHDDERFCNNTYNNNNFLDNDPNNTDAENFFYTYFYNTSKSKSAYYTVDKSKSNVITSRSLSIIGQSDPQCHRGLPLRVWLDNEKNLSTTTCLCPPSYYGDRCQFQNQRVSLTVKLNASFYSQRNLFALVISLIDDSVERIIHSYQQHTYLHSRDELIKFNYNLLYSILPKDTTKQYTIHIDIYDKFSLSYLGSFLVPLKFPFLPVERIAVNLHLPDRFNIINTCSDSQCVHGKCIRYLNNENTGFCQCNTGWSGRYCDIPHICSCSPDSLCIGVPANNRSICVCPYNKFGSQCLLNNNICESNPNNICQNGGQCVPSDEYTASNYSFACICPKGFSGNRCEIRDTKINILFDKDIAFFEPSFLVHFIDLVNNTIHTHNKSLQMVCVNQLSVSVSWSYPFHIALVEMTPYSYYPVINQRIFSQEASMGRLINLSDRCSSIHEIFNESIVQLHLLRRIKYYHLPCQNYSSNVSCFYDDIHMCFCYDDGYQRLANCYEFNYYKQIDDLVYSYDENQTDCFPEYSSNSTTLSSSLSPSTSSTPAKSSGISFIRAGEFYLYLFILLFAFYVHYGQ